MTNNYIKLTAFLSKPRFFFFDSRIAEATHRAYTDAIAAKLEHDSRLPIRDGKPVGNVAHLCIWKKCHLLRESLLEVGEVPEHIATEGVEGLLNTKTVIES